MLELQKITRVFLRSQLFLFFFYERSWQGGVFKVMKNKYFLVFLTIWVLFPNILVRAKGDLC